MPQRPDSKLWHKQTKPDEAASIASRIASERDQRNQPRRQCATENGSMFEGVQIEGVDGDCFDAIVPLVLDGAPIINNRAAAIVETLTSKLAGLDEPRPQFVVTDGTYEQKRQAVWLDRFVEGIYYQPQMAGTYATLWALWRHAFLLAASATGTAAVKIFPDFHARKVACELRSTLDMWVDSAECRYSGPLTYGDRTTYDRELLLDTYYRSDTKTKAILEAPPAPRRKGSPDNTSRDEVQVDELWRVRQTPDDQGKYLMCIGNKALEWDDWAYDTPPFVFYHFRRRLGGFWGASAMERIYHANKRENQVLNRMDSAESRMGTVYVPYDPNVQGFDKLLRALDVVPIPYDAQNGNPAQPWTPPWFPQTAPQLMQIHGQNQHDALGVAAMQTTGAAQQGITAAVAIRTVLSLLNERLAPQQRDIVQAVAVDSGKLIARAGKELYDRFGEFDSAWYGKGFIAKLPGTDCMSLPQEIFTVNLRPVSEKKNSPEDRIQLAQELVSQGVITGGHWLGILRHMDTMGATRQFAKVEEWCEKLFDKFRNSPDGDLRKPGFYRSPPKYMDLDYAMALAVDALLTAQIDEVPDAREQLFLKFLGDLDRKIDQRDARRQAQGLPPKPLPMPGGAPAPAAPAAA